MTEAADEQLLVHSTTLSLDLNKLQTCVPFSTTEILKNAHGLSRVVLSQPSDGHLPLTQPSAQVSSDVEMPLL